MERSSKWNKCAEQYFQGHIVLGFKLVLATCKSVPEAQNWLLVPVIFTHPLRPRPMHVLEKKKNTSVSPSSPYPLFLLLYILFLSTHAYCYDWSYMSSDRKWLFFWGFTLSFSGKRDAKQTSNKRLQQAQEFIDVENRNYFKNIMT